MENLDATIIVTALPTIAAEFGTTATDASIGITAYLLMLAIVMPASGWICDRFGSRNVFCAALAGFTLASLWCACSSSLFEFAIARVLQGASGALMSPVGRVLILSTTQKRDLMKAIATITWPGLIAPVVAPPLGGLIVSYASWHWIFLLNVPLGVSGILLARRFFPRERPVGRQPFDWIGFALGASALTCLIYGLDLAGEGPRNWNIAGPLVGVGAVLCLLAVRHARRHDHPLLKLALARIPTFSVPVLTGGFLSRVAIAGTPFLLPLLFQLGFGLSALDAGLLVLVYMLGNLSMKLATTPILRTFGIRSVLLVNGTLVVATIAALAFVTTKTPVSALWALLFVGGLARSMQFTALNTLTFADVPPEMRSSASMMSSVAQQISAGFGVSLAALTLSLSEAAGEVHLFTHDRFGPAFLVLAVLAMAALPSFLRLERDAGAEVSQRG